MDIVGIIILLVLVGGGGYSIYRFFKNKNSRTSERKPGSGGSGAPLNPVNEDKPKK